MKLINIKRSQPLCPTCGKPMEVKTSEEDMFNKSYIFMFEHCGDVRRVEIPLEELLDAKIETYEW